MTEKELASALGISQQTVSACVQDGMPNDDIAAARSWRQANRSTERNPHKPVFADALEAPEIILAEDADPYATVGRLQQAEIQLAGEIKAWSSMTQTLTNNRNAARSTKSIVAAERQLSQLTLKLDYLRKEQRAAIKALQDAEKKLVQLETARGRLVSVDAAKDYITKILSTVLIAVRKLPDISQNEEERVRLVTIAEGLLTVVRGAAEEALKKGEV